MLQGSLTNGEVFDSSFERGDPIEFELGSGQVIKGMPLYINHALFSKRQSRKFENVFDACFSRVMTMTSILRFHEIPFSPPNQGSHEKL